MDPEGPTSPVSSLKNYSIDPTGRVISFSRVREYGDEDEEEDDGFEEYSPRSDPDFCSAAGLTATAASTAVYDASYDDERLASLEALRYALHHAPFCRNSHTLMSIPDECSLQLQGIPTKCAIRVEGLCYSKGVLDQVNMEVPKGKIYALLGCAGSGKSTLLKCIVGRLRPSSGTVTTFGTIAPSPGVCPTTACSGVPSSCTSSSARPPISAICVGYMPQEVALHDELTVGQTLHHYGRLYQMPLYLIEERISALSTMLHLPGRCAQVRNLNPGQKWRISLAVALIHSPPLLLLDEPTGMVDPLIRWSVWNRLERLCDEEGLTVLITTKYPEEIGFAYKVGLMRNGHIYVEDRPEELRHRYACTTYDELYSRFCESNIPRRIRDSIAPYLGAADGGAGGGCGDGSSSGGKDHLSNSGSMMFPIFDRLGGIDSSRYPTPPRVNRWPLPMAEWPICERRRTAYLSHFINLDYRRLLALVLKNLYVIRGNLFQIMIFYFFFPALQIVFMCAIFGRSVKQLPVTVPIDLMRSRSSDSQFGSTFLHSFLDQRIFTPVYARSLEDAVQTVERGNAWATIVPWTASGLGPPPSPISSSTSQQQQVVKSNSSSQNRSSPLSSSSSTNSTTSTPCDRIEASQLSSSPEQTPYGIRLYLDQSNYVIAQTMFYSFISSMRQFLKSDISWTILQSIQEQQQRQQQLKQKAHNCSKVTSSRTQAESPLPWNWNNSAIDIQEVIYGSTQFRFLEFLLPGFLCSFVFAYSLVLTAYLFIKEHMAGLQDRCLSTGTSGVEVLAAHFLSQAGLYLLQQTMILVIVFRLFGLPSRGPFFSLWLLILLQGLTGIAFGLFIAVICPTPMCAALLTSAVFIPAFFFSGIIWPIESMHRLTQHFSHALPLTLPINSLRYIISRGPDMRYSQIVHGFSISTGYIVVLLLLTVAIFKCKTSS